MSAFDPYSTNNYQSVFSSTPDYFASPYDVPMKSAFANENTILPYLQRNTQEKLDESLTWGEMFDAAWTGTKTGIGSYAPERFYRALRTIGTMLGSDSLQEWAGQGIEENVRERTEDPWYRPDDAWMNKEWGRALYDGFANFTASMTTMAPAVAASLIAAPATGGTSLGALLLMRGSSYVAGSAFSNLLMGLSEFDSFVDQAHQELSAIEPGITRDTVRGEKFWQAVMSGVAEGGIGFLSDKLTGNLTGILGKDAGKKASHIVTKLIRNTYSNVITEMGEEAATAYLQDYAKELADLNYEGRWQAIQNIIKPTLVAGALGGGAKTAFSLGQDASEGAGNTAPSMDVDTLALRESMGKAKESLSPHGYSLLQNLVESEGYSHQDALAATTVLDALANRLAQESGENPATLFQSLDAKDPGLQRLVQAATNPEASLNTLVPEAYDFLHSRLTPEAQAGITQAFPAGNMLEAFQNYLESNGKVEIPESATPGFSAMKHVLTDSVAALGNNSRIKVNEGIHSQLVNSEGTAIQAPKAPSVARNDQAMQQILAEGKADPVQVAGAIEYDSLTGNSPSSPQEAFQQWGTALQPYLEKLGDSQKRRPDNRVLRAAAKELGDNPTLDMMVKYFDKAYGSDKGMAVMNKIVEVVGSKVEQAAARFEGEGSLENAHQLLTLTGQLQLMKQFRDGAASEAGRLLRMVGISRNDRRYADKITAAIQAVGGIQKVEKLATALQNAKTAMEQDTVIDAHSKANGVDMFVEYVTSGMLWSPSTHVVNVLSNATNVFKQIFEKFYAEKFGGEGGVAAGETMKYMFGIWNAFGGLRRMWKSHKAEQGGFSNAVKNLDSMWKNSGMEVGGLAADTQMHRTLTGQNTEALVNRQLDRIGLSNHHWKISDGMSGVIDFLGRAITMPFTLLEHSDMIFKNVTYVAELNALAHRASEGNAEAFQRMLSNPPRDMQNAAWNHAKEMTFQQDMGPVGKWINQARIAVPATRLFLPFLKTPINVLKEGMSMTPGLNYLLGDFRQKLKSADPAVRQMAEAKLMTGSLIWGTAVMLASAGYLTGPGPEDSDERNKQLATGKRFNALKIGDKYYQIDRLDPLAAVFNSAAFVTEIVDNVDNEDFGKAMWMGLGQTMRLLTDRTYIESFADLVNVITQPDQYGDDAMRRLAGMLVPASAMMRTINRDDPFMREADDFYSALKQNIPGLSQTLPVRRDFLGQPIKSADYLGIKWLSPFQVGTETKDPLYKEVNRLHGLGLSAAPMPRRKFTYKGQSIEMDPAEYSQFLERYGSKTAINGKTYTQWLRSFIASAEYKNMADEDRADKINLQGRKYATAAREEIFKASSRMQKQFGIRSQGWEFLLGNTLQ